MRKRNVSAVVGGIAGMALCHILVFRTVFERPSIIWRKKKYDCALVCGCPANLNGSPSVLMRTRVEKAVEYAISLGVPKEQIITETQSVSTYHNMLHSKDIMEDHGLKSCVVVTNGWHLRKANHYAKKFGLDYVMCAAAEPYNATFIRTLWRYISINLHMYFNFYRGLY